MKVTYGAIVQAASGRFGGTVHSNWKGVQVVRRFAKPSNPNSAAQSDVRFLFKNLTTAYLLMPAGTKAAWTTWVTGKPLIARNKLIGVNVPLIGTGPTTWANLQPTPGDSSTLPPTAFTPTGNAGNITTTITQPALPTGWTIAAAYACCIDAIVDPTAQALDGLDCQIYEASDITNPYQPTITAVPAGTYNTWAFIQWNAPDGSTRYSAPLAGGSVVVT